MPTPVMSKEEMLDYLQTHVYRDGDCLTWAGSVSVTGNPRIMWAKKMYLGRRLLMQLSGVDLGNKKVTETCGNKLCMNKAHLLVVTHKQAMVRAARGGKLTVGAIRALKAAMGRSKTSKMPITEAKRVMQMRAEGVKLKDICAKYGVSHQQFYRSEKTWRRVGIL